MVQRVSAVFAGGHLARHLVLHQCHLQQRAVGSAGLHFNRQPGSARPAQRDADRRLCGGRVDALDGVRHAAAPVAQFMAADKEFRGVDRVRSDQAGKAALALGEYRAREWILPANVVPVIDMQRQQYCLRRRHARGAQRADEAIGRRTAAASLRGVQFEQRDRMRRAAAAASLRAGAVPCRAGGESKAHQDVFHSGLRGCFPLVGRASASLQAHAAGASSAGASGARPRRRSAMTKLMHSVAPSSATTPGQPALLQMTPQNEPITLEPR
jgi:hypothetical protein